MWVLIVSIKHTSSVHIGVTSSYYVYVCYFQLHSGNVDTIIIVKLSHNNVTNYYLSTLPKCKCEHTPARIQNV